MCHEVEGKVNQSVRPIITHMLKNFSIEFQQGKDSLCFNNFGEHLEQLKQNGIAQFNVNLKSPPICNLKDKLSFIFIIPFLPFWGTRHTQLLEKIGESAMITSLHYHSNSAVCTQKLQQGTTFVRTVSYTINFDTPCPSNKAGRTDQHSLNFIYNIKYCKDHVLATMEKFSVQKAFLHFSLF